MSEYMSNTCSSECFFEYKIEPKDDDTKKLVYSKVVCEPKVYMERDYNNPALPYTMFLVPQEWASRGKNEGSGDNKALPYDKIKLVYDVYGIDTGVLTTEDGKNGKNNIVDADSPEIYVEMKQDECRRNGCKIKIVEISGNYKSLAGVGLIEMYNAASGALVASFVLTVNFAFKRKIYYDLNYRGGKVDILFECESQPVGINARLVWNDDRLPCLKNDTGGGEDFILEFDNNGRCKKSIALSGASSNIKFFVTITDLISSNYYILHCRSNNTLKIKNPPIKYHPMFYSCPYCHNPIDNRTDSNPRYRRGGISCGFYNGHGKLPVIVDTNDKKAAKCIFCTSDVKDGEFSDQNFWRLLPNNYMAHDTFKVAFLGSARAGKTTYISRFLHLIKSSRTEVQMNMNRLNNSAGKLGVSISQANIARVNIAGGGKYSLTNEEWIKGIGFYNDRVIDLDNYPKATDKGLSTEKYPFIAEVNKSNYIAFYDVAGEDAQNRDMVAHIAGGEGQYLGVFCLVSGSRRADGAAAVFKQLLASNIHKDSPIAVIVTKFDTLAESFDPNCHCTRTDYYDDDTNYADSYLQHEIDYSSEEICSYLKSEGLFTDLSQKYTNVKYFSLSSFNFMECIHAKDEDLKKQEDETENMKFDCSSYRLELPFVWMLNQFGIIK